MFTRIIIIYIINVILVISVLADYQAMMMLKNRLRKNDDFYGCVEQIVSDINNNELMRSSGELWFKRPNLLHWHTISGEESILIFDGETLWFYIPGIKQAIAYCIQDISADNIFFTLFCNNNNFSQWNNYTVLYQKDNFIVAPVHDNINFKECHIKITDKGVINQFTVFEKSGRCINYYFSKQNNNLIDMNKFVFVVSKDVQLDDQRK